MKLRSRNLIAVVIFLCFATGYIMGIRNSYTDKNILGPQPVRLIVFSESTLPQEVLSIWEASSKKNIDIFLAKSIEEFIEHFSKSDLALFSWSLLKNRPLPLRKNCDSQEIKAMIQKQVSPDFKTSEILETGVLPLFWKHLDSEVEVLVLACPDRTEKNQDLEVPLHELIQIELIKKWLIQSKDLRTTFQSLEDSELESSQKASSLRGLPLKDLNY